MENIMSNHMNIQNRVFDLIQDGLSYVYKFNATTKSRNELLTSEILHLLYLCGESLERPHWRVPMEKLLDLSIEDEDSGLVNWANETWHTSQALIAHAQSITPKDKNTRLNRKLIGAVKWLLNERGGWKGTWDGELWETSLALIALMSCKKSRLVDGRQLRWLSSVLDWLINTGSYTKNHLGYHYIGLILWALQDVTENFNMKSQQLKSAERTKSKLSNYILQELRTSPELVLPEEACWMTGIILYGLIHCGRLPRDQKLIHKILDYIEKENQIVEREGWYDLETTYYMLLALIELYHFLENINSKITTKIAQKRAYQNSVKGLHENLKKLRDAAEKPVDLLSPGCPIGHERCEYRDTTLLDERYDYRKVFLAIPFKGYERQQKTIEDVLKLAGLIPVISNPEAEQVKTSTNILCQICQRISESRYGLADLTGIEQHPNIAYELGLMQAFNRKVGLLVESMDIGPDSIEQHFSDIKQLQYHKYASEKDKGVSLAESVKKWICSIKASSIDLKIFEKEFSAKYNG
jgi:hypothetical protein